MKFRRRRTAEICYFISWFAITALLGGRRSQCSASRCLLPVPTIMRTLNTLGVRPFNEPEPREAAAECRYVTDERTEFHLFDDSAKFILVDGHRMCRSNRQTTENHMYFLFDFFSLVRSSSSSLPFEERARCLWMFCLRI